MRKGSAKAAAPLGLNLALAAVLLIRIVWDGAACDAVPAMESDDPPPVAEEIAELIEAPETIILPPPPAREKPTEVAALEPEPLPVAPPPVEVALSLAPAPVPAPAPPPAPAPAPAPALEPLRPHIVAEAAPVPQAIPGKVNAPTPLQPQPQPQRELSSESVETPEPEPPVALRSQPQRVLRPVTESVEVTAAETPQPLSPAPQPTPDPTPAPAVTPEPPAPPVRVADPPQPAPPPTPYPVVDETVLAEGRPLLRILEHGSGPVIEIAWPDGQVAREQLYETFTTCFGMRVAVMDRNGTLFAAEGRAGAPWAVNLDRYSGFVRQPTGRVARAEMHEAERALAHHGARLRASPVRVFPRRVDALLLGGLRRVTGERYSGADRIRAAYWLDGRRVFVTGINVDGRPVAGRIDLSLASLARCR